MIASAELQKMQGYIAAVMADEIPVAHITRAAVMRYQKDLERESTDEFPYHFDSEAAENACLFFSCLRHSIGQYAGKPFVLEPWQCFGVANIFGWKSDIDGTRRFRKVYWSTARKNGKSTFAAGLAFLCAMADINPATGQPEEVAEIILCATKRQQVEKTIYNELKRMRLQTPEIKQASTTINRQISFPATDSTIECVASDRAYDGRNPLAVFKDELHEFRAVHEVFLDTMDTGGGSRLQPLDVMTTTAGARNSHIWRGIYKYARGVAFGDINDPAWFVWCFELDAKDDPLDPANWPKANPNLGISLRLKYLEDQAKPAASSPRELNKFTRYHGNRMTDSRARAFDMEKWDACCSELSDWSQADAVGAGVDLGGRDDLASFALCARFAVNPEAEDPVWRYELRQWSFIAADCERDVTVQPFADWIYEDRIRQVEHPLAMLQGMLIEECYQHYVTEIAYDPHGGQMLAEEIETHAGIRCGRMSQTCASFNEPISALLEAINEGRFRHDGDPVLRWAAENAVLITNWKRESMFSRRDSNEKIDPIVAGCMAFRRAMLAPRSPVAPFSSMVDSEPEQELAGSPEAAAKQYAESIFDD